MKRITPVLVVDEIEPSLPLWIEDLGFDLTTEVPDGDRLGFVILEREDLQVMYQTHRSLDDDVALEDRDRPGRTVLFVEVEDIDAVDAATSDAERFLQRRTAFYGAEEIGVREPGGHLVIFAEFGAQE